MNLTTTNISLSKKIEKITGEVESRANIIFNHGDFLMIKNQRVLHKRTAFFPKYDDNERWRIRLSV